MKSLKARLTGDPKRLARAMQAFYRQHGLTPVRNLLACCSCGYGNLGDGGSPSRHGP